MDDLLPWDKKSDLSIETFLMKYTLHDSFWVGLFFDGYSDDVTLAFKWDGSWLPDEIKKSRSWVHEPSWGLVADWPFLFIRIIKVDQISFSKFRGFAYCGIAGIEFETIEGRKFLAIDGVDGVVSIVFSGEVSFLALEPNEQILSI
jgi:hypothetical protein